MEGVIEILKTYDKTKRRPPTCSYCNISGHSINNCRHESLKIMHDELKNAAAFSVCALNSLGYIIIRMEEKALNELRALCYYTNIKIVDKTRYNYMCQLKEYYCAILVNAEETLKEIPDEELMKYIQELCSITHDYGSEEELWKKVRPQKRKYNINVLLINSEEGGKINCKDCPICLEEETNDQMVKMNCCHEFCGKCIKGYLDNLKINLKPRCALCRTITKTLECRNNKLFNDIKIQYCGEEDANNHDDNDASEEEQLQIIISPTIAIAETTPNTFAERVHLFIVSLIGF
jgi:hypothetical protein